MAKTEATVTSSVKNWYINFFIGIVGPCGMPIGAKTMKMFAKSKLLDFKVLRPPQGSKKKHKYGAQGDPWGLWGPIGTHGAQKSKN